MLQVGLTGGLASGKSFVGKTLADLGCFLIRADELGHQVLEPGGEAYEGAIREFGGEITGPDGRIDRRKLAALAFHDPQRLEKLNALVHPPVRERTSALLDEFRSREPDGIAVVEAAILIETGRYRDFDRLILAVCSRELQIERAMARDNATGQEVLDRMNRQMPLEDKIKYADYVIDTSGTKDETRAKVSALYDSLKLLTKK